MSEYKELSCLAYDLRKKVVEMVVSGKGGHIGGARRLIGPTRPPAERGAPGSQEHGPDARPSQRRGDRAERGGPSAPGWSGQQQRSAGR